MRRPLLASADANRRGATRVRTIAVIQARMNSTRLPGKVLMTVLGRPMLGYKVERVARARRLDGMVIATTSNASDDPVAAFAGKAGVPVFRGSEADVLGRVAGAAAALDATHVVRLTGDCPLSDPEIIDAVAARLIEGSPPVDFVTNGIPRSWPVGVDAEAIDRNVNLAVADRYFFGAEGSWLAGLPPAGRAEGFLRLWTLKEAYIKATGRGLSQPLDEFWFEIDPPRIRFTPAIADDEGAWRFDQRVLAGRFLVAVGWRAGCGDGGDDGLPEVALLEPEDLSF